MDNIYKQTLEKIAFLYKGYSTEYRATTQPFRLEMVKDNVKDYVYKYDDLLVREPLIEHSGSLAIVATTVYPNINDSSVDLGRALIMIAIHDIGELIIGDESTFTKKSDEAGEEKKAALSLLPSSLHDTYIEMEERLSNTARFAKSIDKITPDILDLICPAEVTIERMRKFANKEPSEIVSTIKEFKHPYMLWNDFMTKLHLELLDQIDKKLKSFY